jgi:hypothetical protein
VKKGHSPRTLFDKLSALDDQLFFLRESLHGLKEDTTHFQALSGELRSLICLSKRNEGLLWRLVDELKVADAVHIHLAGNVDTSHPLIKGLRILAVIT